jgi:hypothetical protein
LGSKYYTLNKEMFLLNPISTDEPIRETNNRTNSIGNRGTKQGNSVGSQLVSM